MTRRNLLASVGIIPTPLAEEIQIDDLPPQADLLITIRPQVPMRSADRAVLQERIKSSEKALSEKLNRRVAVQYVDPMIDVQVYKIEP